MPITHIPNVGAVALASYFYEGPTALESLDLTKCEIKDGDVATIFMALAGDGLKLGMPVRRWVRVGSDHGSFECVLIRIQFEMFCEKRSFF